MYPNRNDIINIIKSYRKYTLFHEYCNCVYDRFGYWNNKQIHHIPQYTEESIEKYSIKRVKEIGPQKILWSGGIDSTFIICSYIKAKIPFIIVCDDQSINDGQLFYEWMRKNKIEIIKFTNICEAYNLQGLLHGDVADQLFSPDEKRRTTLPDNINFFENIIQKPDGERLCEQIIEYGKLLNKPTDTNAHIIRMINFGNMYFHGRNELYYTLFPTNQMISFFDTSEFNNIAYTQYWERTILDDKPEMHRFICDVTQDERMMWGVYRSPTNIKPRLPRIKENFRIWENES